MSNKNKPIRILHVVGGMNVGGTESFIMNLYRSIDKNKIQFDFIVYDRNENYYEKEILEKGGKIFKSPTCSIKNINRYKKWWKTFLLNHKEYSIIQGHIGSSAPVYLKIAKKYGLYTIAHSHATKSNKKSLKEVIWYINSFRTRFIADYFFACSKQAGIDRFGKNIVNSKRFAVVKNGIDAERFIFNKETKKRIRHNLKINDNCIVIGNVGRFEKVKNHKYLLNVFKEYNCINSNSILMLIGDGPLKEQIIEYSKQLDIFDKVLFLGIKDKVEEYYNAMDIFCFPSKHEGLGISLVEAQSCGLKCIASDAIQDEADLEVNLLERISLEKGVTFWAKEIVNNIEIQKEGINKLLSIKCYNVKDNAKKIEEFYNNIVENVINNIYTNIQ